MIDAWAAGKGSVRELAKAFDLGEATVNRWVAGVSAMAVARSPTSITSTRDATPSRVATPQNAYKYPP